MKLVTKGTALLMAFAATAALGACGSDADDADKSPPAQAAKPSRLAIELTGSAKSPSFSVPASVKGGTVEIELTNSAKGEHSAQLVTADEGHTPQQALEAGNAWGEKGKALPDWAHVAGGVGNIKEGETWSVTQELAPGKYLVADLESGASAEFEVTGASGEGELADDGGTIEAREYAFESEGLKAGRNNVLFDNTGAEPHFIVAAALKPGKTLADARRFFKTEKGEPPVDESTGFSTAVVEGGERQSVELHLKAGKYVLLCFVPDRAGGPPHATKGMISEAVVGG
jgi:hypothetical protein